MTTSFALLVLTPFMTSPRPHRAAGIVFGSGFDDKTSLAMIAVADPRARVLDLRWHGHLVFVDYDDAAFPAAIGRTGALYMFDAVAAGCHTSTGITSTGITDPFTPPAR